MSSIFLKTRDSFWISPLRPSLTPCLNIFSSSLCPNIEALVDGDGVITDGRLDDNDATEKLPPTQSAQISQVCVGSHT